MRALRGQNRFVAVTAALGLVIAATILGESPRAAWAKDYPSWDDVANARNSEAATQSQISAINALITALGAEVDRTAADAQAKGEAWGRADTAHQTGAAKALTLSQQADAAAAAASESEQRAGQMAAQLMRVGGGDLTATLLTGSGDPDSLLYGLGMSGKIAQQANAIYERALLDRNTAQALTDQARVAEDELETLKIAAEKAFADAQAASIAAAEALAEQQSNQARLAAQLKVLTERRAATEADYAAGEAIRIEEERKAAEAAAAGAANSGGWAKPVNGRITSSFGYRVSPTAGASSYHQGTDIGAYCGAPIYAGSSGTVVYAGWNGGYGNFILIDHGGGVATAYAHIVSGGVYVGYGQQVAAGTHIASVGTTGTSTGCHLHLEVRINGVARDSVPFFADRGITIG